MRSRFILQYEERTKKQKRGRRDRMHAATKAESHRQAQARYRNQQKVQMAAAT